ncbi:hypothetical protein ACFWHW_12535 [Streptomyces pharetrae]|uniref:hypothetical protein n=1 Tax=Streptomyces pharetrae TaxID=291370 RepID=UPI00364AE368
MTEHGVSRPVAVTSTFLFGTDAPGEGLFSRTVGNPSSPASGPYGLRGGAAHGGPRTARRPHLDGAAPRRPLRHGHGQRPPAGHPPPARSPYLPFTSRADLAHALLRHATGDSHVHAVVGVRTTENTAGMLGPPSKEALGK